MRTTCSQQVLPSILQPLASSDSPLVTTLTAACVPKSVRSKHVFAQQASSRYIMTAAASYTERNSCEALTRSTKSPVTSV